MNWRVWRRADADLIAAAPDLLELCKTFEHVLTTFGGTNPAALLQHLAALRETIAKAKGEAATEDAATPTPPPT